MQHFRKNPLFVVLMTIFIDMLGVGILIPVVPLLLTDPTSPFFLLPKGLTLDQGFIMLGFLTATFPLAQFFATPILGQLSDRYGRKKILLVSLVGTCVAYLMFGLAIFLKNIPLLFITRIFDGFTGGNIAVAQAAIADITKPQDRAKNFGFIGAAFGLGFIIGPFIGGVLSNPAVISWFNPTTPFLFAGLLSFINIISVILIFPETHLARNARLVIQWSKSLLNIVHAFTYKSLRVLFTTAFLFQSGFSFFTTFFAVYLIRKFNFHEGDIGNFFAFIGIWVVITQALITRFVAKRFKEQSVLKLSLVAFSLCVLAYVLPSAAWQLYALIPLFAIFNGLIMANMTSLVSRSADKEVQGEVLGINASVQALAQAIPPILSGYIAASLSIYHPIVIGALVVFISAVVFLIWFKPTGQFHESTHS